MPGRFWKGKKLSHEHRRKLSEAHKKRGDRPPLQTGKIPWNKGKKFLQISGKNNCNWKGGITSVHQVIRTSLEYKLWREAVFKRDKHTCRFCGKRGGQLNADHIKPFAHYPELRFAIDNGRTLCVECHKQTETYGKHLCGKL